jgi:imidazoleglycerol phosphate dehydratase HisB
VLDMSTLGDVADVNPVIKFLSHMLQHLASKAATASTILCRSCGKSYIGGTYMPPMPRDLPCVEGT